MQPFIGSVPGLGSCDPKAAEEGMRWIVLSIILVLLWAVVMTAIAVRQARPTVPRREESHE